MNGRIALVLMVGLAFAGCSSDSEPTPNENGELPETPATPLSAAAFCDEIAKVTCSADAECCESTASGASGSSGSAGSGGSGWPGSSSESDGGTEEEEPCEVKQAALCRGTIGELVSDPRTGYDPAKGGQLLEALQSAAKSCFSKPITHAQILETFRGSGEIGANCTPEDNSLSALRVSALSCKSGTSCRLYLTANGSKLGTCEERTDNSCSHPLDCGSGEWCNLPGDWKPGVWGECHPLRTEGWSCSSDLECASQYCDASKTCAPESARRYCLQTPYAAEVAADEPLLHLRLGDSTSSQASDASGNGHDAELLGAPGATAGALTGDDDGAMTFDGLDDRVKVPAGSLENLSTLTIELWANLPEGTVGKPLLAFGDDTEGGPVIALDAEGRLQANFADTNGDSHVIDSGDTRLQPAAWNHIVVTYDGLRAELFLNGSKLSELEEPFTPRTSGEIHVGYAAPENFLGGAIDEVAVYGTALREGRTLEHRTIATQGPDRIWPIYRWFQ